MHAICSACCILTGVVQLGAFVCLACKNDNPEYFRTDLAAGDIICMGKDGKGTCGVVFQDHYLNETSAFRKFEGEEDKNHNGPAFNKLFSTSQNLRTAIQGGRGTDMLRRTADYVEMNLSQFGKDERRTRIGYKDQQKKDAFAGLMP